MRSWVELLLAWSLAFIFAESIGVIVSSTLRFITSQTLAVSLGLASTFLIRVSVIVFLAPRTGIALPSIYKDPLPTRRFLLLAVTLMTAVLASLVNWTTSGGALTIIQYSNFAVNGALWTTPFFVAYYLSEVIVLNYLYVLAKRAWSLLGSRALAGNVFLIIGWASLHAISQNLVTAVFAVLLVPILYASYEYTGRSPLTPILLWFVVLVF